MTMTFIASYTAPAGGSGSAVFFNNIPQTFTHLQFRVFGRSQNASSIASIYQPGNAFHQLRGDGANATSVGFTSQVNTVAPLVANSSTANAFQSIIIDILDYTNTNKNKTIRMLGGYDANGSGIVYLVSGLITSTSAITSWFFDTESFFAQNSRIDLYGIGIAEQTGA